MPFFRDAKARANVVADPLPAMSRLDTGEQVKASLKPRRESVGKFQCLVQGMVAGHNSVDRLSGSLERVVAMQFQHVLAGRDRFRGVDLNLVIVLGEGRAQPEKRQTENQKGLSQEPNPSIGNR